MHRASFFIRAHFILALVMAGAVAPAWAVPVTSLYVVIVPGADPTQAAQEAMRVELVRLTGRRSAASDTALQGLIDGARQYVQLERATTSGQVQVLFDEPALASALTATGAVLWDADRPLLWVSLPALDPASDQALRVRLAQAAQERGLPILVTSAPAEPAALTAPAATAAPAVAAGAATTPTPPGGSTTPPVTIAAPSSASPPTAAGALDAAHAAGANAALVAVSAPAQPGTLQWTLSTANGGGQWVGSPELAIDQAADTLAAARGAFSEAALT